MPNRALASLLLITLTSVTAMAQSASPVHQPKLTPQNSATTSNLIAVSPVNDRVVWASGRNGIFAVTTNGGDTWKAGVVRGAESLELRDVQGISATTAYVLSIGPEPSDFRIYKTEDGGANWAVQFRNQIFGAFYDCFAFWTPERGIAVSDSVNGTFPNLRTSDGKTWENIGKNMPPALQNEGSFASSGTCIAKQAANDAWIVTGNATTARVLATHDGGNTWSASNTPFASSQAAGAFSVAFRDAQNGMIGGGDLNPKNGNHAATAISHDGGKTWSLTSSPPVMGAVYGLSYLTNTTAVGDHRGAGGAYDHIVVIAANTGAAWSPDEGTSWYSLPDVTGYWGVAFASPQAGWMVGTKGRILKISF
jgi:photosystem II stability/assembly factor-like uncharacterized protein